MTLPAKPTPDEERQRLAALKRVRRAAKLRKVFSMPQLANQPEVA